MKKKSSILSALLLVPVINSTVIPVLAEETELASAQAPSTIRTDENSAPAVNQEPAQTSNLRITYDEPASKRLDIPNSTTPSLNQVDALSNEILGYEIELLKLNTNFRIKSTDKNRIKPWRTFLYNLAGSGVATAGITTIAAERWRTWRRPATASRTALKAGPIMLLTSHSIIAGGIILEAALDVANDRKIKKAGYDPKTMEKRALALVGKIDEKLKERDNLLVGFTALSEEERSQAAEETPVLRDMRNMAVTEFCNFHTRAKKRIAARNFSYLNGFIAATTGGYLGSLCGLLAVTARKPRLAGPAGIGFTISGANIATGPELGRLAGNIAGSFDKSHMKKDFGETPKPQLAEHLNSLRQHSNASKPAAMERLSIYDTVSSVMKKQAEMNAIEKKKADREYLERCMFNAMIGGSKMAWGIQLMNAGFSFNPTLAKAQATAAAKKAAAAKSATKTASAAKTVVSTQRPVKTQTQLFAQRVAQGATSYIPGTSLWILDTLQARARGEMDVYTMGQQQALPHQKLAERLSKLNDVESKLKSIAQ